MLYSNLKYLLGKNLSHKVKMESKIFKVARFHIIMTVLRQTSIWNHFLDFFFIFLSVVKLVKNAQDKNLTFIKVSLTTASQ